MNTIIRAQLFEYSNNPNICGNTVAKGNFLPMGQKDSNFFINARANGNILRLKNHTPSETFFTHPVCPTLSECAQCSHMSQKCI